MANGTLKVGTITTSTGSGNITIGSGVTLQSNVPAFEAYLSTDQSSITSATLTKVQFANTHFDTNSNYSTTNYRFTPSEAGKYFFYSYFRIQNSSGNTNLGSSQVALYKNGSLIKRIMTNPAANYMNSMSLTLSTIAEANGSTDYFEIYIYGLAVSGTVSVNGDSSGDRSIFGAYRIGA